MESQLGPNNARLGQGTASSLSSMRQSLPSGYESQAAMVPFLPPGTNVQYPMHHGYPLYLAPVWPAGQIPSGNDPSLQSSPPSSDDGETRPLSDSSTRSSTSIGSAQRTLFIAGLPSDVKEREIFNMLRFQPGFVDCSLTPSTNGKQAVAFASWRDHESASRCRDLLQGLRFDPFGPVSYLRIQFARSESKTRRTPVDAAAAASSSSSWPSTTLGASSSPLVASEAGSYSFFQTSSATASESSAPPSRQGGGSPAGSVGAPASFISAGEIGSTSSISSSVQLHRTSPSPKSTTPNPVSQDTRALSARSGTGVGSGRPSVASPAKQRPVSTPALDTASSSSSTVVSSSSSAPATSSVPALSSRSACPTLFVTNLGMLTTEQDLTLLFSASPGFHRLRFQLNTEGLPICFVDFDSETNSAGARDQFQGYLLHHTPLRIEFAKQKMKRIRKR